jgi:hypothetical protein
MNRELTDFLATIPSGAVPDPGDLERILAACWHEFTGDDGGLTGQKLLGRMEEVVWEPPILTFKIERHGGTVLGSSRAELQHWQVNIQEKTALIVTLGHRQLMPMAKRIYIKPLVGKILEAIRAGSETELVWRHPDGTVAVKTTTIFPTGSAVKMTLEGRRKRLREGLASALLKEGWLRLGPDIFRPPISGD